MRNGSGGSWIEASCRILHRARARPSTRNPAIRLVWFGLAFLIENAWVAIKYERLSTKRRRRSGRIAHDLLLRFERFLAWLLDAVHQAFSVIDQIVGSATAKERGFVNSSSQEVTRND